MGVSRRIREEEVGWVNSGRGMAGTKFTDSGTVEALLAGSRSLWLLDLGWIKP